MNAPKLVIGANGFLGSHVTRQLVADCAPQKGEVRAMVRPAANTRSIDDLPLTRFHGDVFDTATVAEAMAGCDDVYYCVVDTRAWLRDPSPLFRTNVAGLRNVLDVATDASLRRFVFTSSYATVGRRRGHVATEEDRVDTRKVTPYVRSRVAAEDLVLQYAHDAGLPAVAMCVSTTLEVQRARTVIDFAARRVNPPVYQLGEWVIPRGYSIIINIAQIHGDPDVFPQPDRFDPQRYIGSKPSPFAWIPFGGGTRRCVGAAFANMEMDVVLRTVLRHFTLETTTAAGERSHGRGVAFTPKDGGRVVMRRR